ncbi:hypothetical protein AB6A40_010154 [Gnathostoma spinigerum]|uniref:PDZ domain-containing protein n=1 Tax=Gnathostoma spinigerum TaxID=75299 RepID=A0ABD6F2V1_9BILA
MICPITVWLLWVFILKRDQINKFPSVYSGSNLDWTDDLSDLSEEKPADMITVRLDRNETGSLGVQIASVAGSVYVKQLTAEPAISNPEIKIGDKVVQINGQSTANLVHQQVVDLLRKGGRTVLLGLQRMRSESPPHSDVEKTIKVVLEKSPTGSLGLSLAKKTGLDGIFIRMIGTGSAADLDGSLRIGDKIWEINGKPVHSWSPGAIVDMLKSATNPVEIVVKREVHR